jgi:hypothetical protein
MQAKVPSNNVRPALVNNVAPKPSTREIVKAAVALAKENIANYNARRAAEVKRKMMYLWRLY